MSRMATAEYIGVRIRAYLAASKEKRHQILAEVCETTGYEKKYANKLLLGLRKFKEGPSAIAVKKRPETKLRKPSWR